MKKTSSKSVQSSVPVQHSHTAELDEREKAVRLANDACRFHPELEKAPATPAPERKDNRERTGNLPPIDHEARATNRKLDTETLIALLRDTLPSIARRATVVGSWVWLSFDTAPEPTTRAQISQLGFHWNNTRQVWQHPCGKFTFGSKSDPRDNYATKPAMEAFA
jgi:hypothetical protein